MRYIFFGTPRFAAIVLEELKKAGIPPALVVTNPDRPAGRKKVLTPPPAKLTAEASGIPVWQPEKLDPATPELKGDWDFFVVAAYAKILKNNVLTLPRLGTLGIHPSLLPKYRGASPIQSALLTGEKESGVTIYLLDEAVDHGSILGQTKVTIAPETNYLALEESLARAGGRLLAEILPKYADKKIAPVTQNHAEATFTKKFKTEDGLVDLTKDAPELIYRKIKALNPEPGVYTILNGMRTKLLEAKLVAGKIHITKIQKAGGAPKATELIL